VDKFRILKLDEEEKLAALGTAEQSVPSFTDHTGERTKHPRMLACPGPFQFAGLVRNFKPSLNTDQ
jgi:hypothetical protein